MPASNCSIVFFGAIDGLAGVGPAGTPLAIFAPLTLLPPMLGCFELGLESDTPFEEEGPGSRPVEMLMYRTFEMILRSSPRTMP
jgi:hypothetical protein